VSVLKSSVGTVVVEDDEPCLASSFFFCWSLFCRLLLDKGSCAIPRDFSWSEVSKLPQILVAESIPSFASNAKSIGEVHGKIEQGNALF
jgi:hypothetical protein